MNNEFASRLLEAFEKNNLPSPDRKQTEQLEYYMNAMLEVNKNHFNLTAICDLDGVVYKHFADCAVAVYRVPENASLIDVGSGAGLPALPAAILRPELSVTALDSTAKKMNFVSQVAAELDLKNLTAVTGRAEELAKPGGELREKFDAAIARAVAELPVLTELCMPLVKKGGRFIAMKSGKEDVSRAEKAVIKTGGRISEVENIVLHTPNEDCSRKLIIVDKLNPTPPNYPRAYAEIARKPLV